MANGYDRLSSVYDLLTKLVFGKSIRNAQFHFLSKIPHNSKILIVGGGTGWLLREVIKRTSPKTIVYVDSSDSMINMSRRSIEDFPLEEQEKVEFIQTRFESLSVHKQVDVVITPFFLDLFNDTTLPPVMEKVVSHLTPNGLWLFSDFRYPSKGIFKVLGLLLIRFMYLFFRVTSGLKERALPAFLIFFNEIGAHELGKAFFYGGIIQTRIFAFPSPNR